MASIGQYPDENSHVADKTKEAAMPAGQETRRRPRMRSQEEMSSV